MKTGNYADIELMPVTMPGSSQAGMRVLVGKKDGAVNFVMRLFEVEPGGFTPFHNHNYEHEVFILAGAGVLVGETEQKAIAAGHFVYLSPNEMHQFKNTGASTLKFLCLIPAENSTY